MPQNQSRSSKRDNDDDLSEMREAFRQHKARQKGGGSKNDWDKLDGGKNLRRWLPIPGSKKFYTEAWTHFGVGPNERAVRCIDEDHIDQERGLPVSGTTCPRCKRFLREQARINSRYEKRDPKGQEEWKQAKQEYVPRHQFFSNTLREDDDGDFEVKITPYGAQIWGQLMNYYVGDDTNVGDFSHPKSGTWLNVKKTSKGGSNRRNVSYEVFPVDGPDIYDSWDTIKDALHDLDVAAGKIISVDEFVAIETGVDDADADDGGGRRRRDRERDDDRRERSRRDDDDDDRRGRRGRDDDDDDDDRRDRVRRDDDRRDSDDSDDDDDRPVTSRRSRLAKKMRDRGDD